MSEFLKCDADGCDHHHAVDRISEDLIGTPCPKCGSDMLTSADYEAWVTLIRPGIEAMKSLGLLESPSPETPREHIISVNMHDGEFRVRTERNER